MLSNPTGFISHTLNQLERFLDTLPATFADGYDLDYTKSFYEGNQNDELIELFAIIHLTLNNFFSYINIRFVESITPADENRGYLHASNSRDLIHLIEIVSSFHRKLKSTPFEFDIEPYYYRILSDCKKFLRNSNGSLIPLEFEKINILEDSPIFFMIDSIAIPNEKSARTIQLEAIGEGSYAKVFRYIDPLYEKVFCIKKAKDDLNAKEMERFKREFEILKTLQSPYVVEAYAYDQSRKEYSMEYMNYSLYDYIIKNHSTINSRQKTSLISQILKAFEYIHAKNILHRDISPKNILIKNYEDVIICKISDFGLVKIPNSTLTSKSTEFKGCFNDDSLKHEGFDAYSMSHEIYALTRIVYFVLTQKINTTGITHQKLKDFVENGIHPDKTKRYKNVGELRSAYNYLMENL